MPELTFLTVWLDILRPARDDEVMLLVLASTSCAWQTLLVCSFQGLQTFIVSEVEKVIELTNLVRR